MTRLPGTKFLLALDPSGLAKYGLDLVVVGAAYFVLASVSLTLASLHSSAMPIWPPTGLALAAILLRGLRVWPDDAKYVSFLSQTTLSRARERKIRGSCRAARSDGEIQGSGSPRRIEAT